MNDHIADQVLYSTERAFHEKVLPLRSSTMITKRSGNRERIAKVVGDSKYRTEDSSPIASQDIAMFKIDLDQSFARKRNINNRAII